MQRREFAGRLAVVCGLVCGMAGAVAGAITVAPGVTLYQLTENGLALQATIQGTKYFKNDDLNAK